MDVKPEVPSPAILAEANAGVGCGDKPRSYKESRAEIPLHPGPASAIFALGRALSLAGGRKLLKKVAEQIA